jgi:hypothetical protein
MTKSIAFGAFLLSSPSWVTWAAGEDACLADPALASLFPTTEGSCCQKDVCNIPCPVQLGDPGVGTYSTCTCTCTAIHTFTQLLTRVCILRLFRITFSLFLLWQDTRLPWG